VRPKPVRCCCQGQEAEVALDGFAARAVADVADVVLHALVLVVTEVIGHFGFKGAFDQGFGDLLENAVLTGQVFGRLVSLEELVDEFRVKAGRAGRLGHACLLVSGSA
jgi:hypothetical protein